ncbi:MAG: Mov34/MPN/PAD-1 family protein [Hadesarchaea archaeon]|nr:Mov34/MPN/PAD-1 family protein [Hadesarchaea archaeon]
MSIREIEQEALELILGASKSSHPNEFAGILREENDVITEILLIPGTSSSERSAVMRLHMMPIDSSACGTVHSHPAPDSSPSEADLSLFNKFGEVHIIVAKPYNDDSWQAYDFKGNKINLSVRE